MTQTFIKKGIFTISLNLLILLIGYFTLPYLSNEFIPSVEIPAVAVIVPSPLMPMKQIEREVASPLEKAFIKTGELKSVETRIEEGKAILILFYQWSLTPEEALRRARQVVDKEDKAPGTLDPIFILHRPSNNPIFRVTFYGNDIIPVSKLGREKKTMFERIPGVSEVSMVGDVPASTVVQVDPNRIMERGISTQDILASAKKDWNLNQFLPGEKFNYLLTNNVDSVEKIKLLPVSTDKGKKTVPLGQISKIYDKKGTSKVIYGASRPAVIIDVIKTPGADTIGIVQKCLDLIKGLKGTVEAKVIYNEAEKIKESQQGVFKNFFIGVFLNSIILMSFLGSPIGVLVASVVFPTSLLGTLFMMKYFGISINLFSLNGFSLAVGMITDASTVVLESITRRFQEGEELFKACYRGVSEVSLGVLASTLTTAGVLLPIAMQKNITSKLFSDLSLTVVSTQMLCLIAVFSLVPWLCFNMLKKDEKRNFIIEKVFVVSSGIVNFMVGMAHKVQETCRQNISFKYGVPGGVIFFSLGMLIFLPKTEFLPMVSSRVYSLNYPINKSVIEQDSTKVRDQFGKALSDKEEVKWAVTSINPSGVESLFEIEKPKPISKVKKFFTLDNINPERVHVLPVGPAPVGEPMGYDGLIFVSNTIEAQKFIDFNQKFCTMESVAECLAQEFYQMTNKSITPKHLNLYQVGSNEIESLSQIIIPLNEIDIGSMASFRYERPVLLNVEFEDSLLDLPMKLGNGGFLKLGSMFDLNFDFKPSVLNRLNNESFAPIYFRIQNTTLGDVATQLFDLAKNIGIKISKIVPRGGMETMEESFSSMIQALMISAGIVFLILVIQFQSVGQALIIMGTIPLTLGGAIIGLLIMGETLNASVMVGFILLVGIVVNNGIFLIEATNQKLGAGLSNKESIQLAVKERTRPILMTSFSTIFGMLPTLLIGGEGSELYRGMAIVNVFGMVTGTVLSIVVTPIIIEMFLPKEGSHESAHATV